MAKSIPQPLQHPILMATIGAAQGLRGEVRVTSYTGDPAALGHYGRLHGADGRVFEILEIRSGKTMLVVRFRGVNDRTAAEALKGTQLFIERDSLPDEELDEDEFFYTDLEGLEAVDAEGRIYGIITGIYDFGGGDLIELTEPGKRPTLIPFSEAAVLDIDLNGRRITVDPAAAGLLDNDREAGREGPGSRRRRPPKDGGEKKGRPS